MSTLNKNASWVVVDKKTGTAIFETYVEKTAMGIDADKYTAVPILEYLQSINKKGK